MKLLLFPGQGVQEVGMGRDLAENFPIARETLDEANDVLGYDLAAICFDGPAERLTETAICQPALVAVSVAAWRVATEHGLAGDVAMGHSLGEYAALVASGALPYAEALRIVAERGAAMQEAAEASPGAMAALLGLDDDEATALCEKAGDVWAANFNCPGQVVASGTTEGIDRLLDFAKADGVKVARLAVSGAFHSPLMESAAERLRPALAAWEPDEPSLTFLSTTSGEAEGTANMRSLLEAQLTSPVRFSQAVSHALDLGVTEAVEFGPGRVLSGLVKRVNRRIPTTQFGRSEDLAELAAL